MVINVSGRTDIVAFYMDWFLNRIKDGYFLTRNPIYKKQVYRINYEDIDLIVFCTKNPRPLLENIDKITKPFIIYITLTPYGSDIEPNVPDKKDTIEVIKSLSRIIGKNKIFIRYDPIFLNSLYTIEYLIRAFDKIINELDGYTNTVIVSFLDEYKNVLKNKDILDYRELISDDLDKIGKNFIKIASIHNMTIQTCAEDNTLFEYGFIEESCVSKQLVETITGKTIKEKWNVRKNKNCKCVQMYDIGSYNTCTHMCKYCYANYEEIEILKNKNMHDVNSPLLIGKLNKGDEIKVIK